jgi:GT2 family glycosyltransferase
MPFNSRLSVSAIIPTKNRPADLELTVRTLVNQTVLPKQLIIVDQSVTDESRQQVERVIGCESGQASGRIDLDYIWDSEVSGLAAARNCAMSRATGNIWLFLDDDVQLEANFVEEMVAAYHLRPGAIGVSGIVTNYRPPSAAIRYWTTVFVCGPFHDDRQPVYWNSENLQSSEPIPVSRLGGGLMSFRADAIRDLRFDENLRGVCDGEDIDFCCQLPKSSLLFIAPLAHLTHNQSPIGRSQQHWLSRHVRANYFLYRKHWANAIGNRLCFVWLNTGYFLIACLASLKRWSFDPWRHLIESARETNALINSGRSTKVAAVARGKKEEVVDC